MQRPETMVFRPAVRITACSHSPLISAPPLDVRSTTSRNGRPSASALASIAGSATMSARVTSPLRKMRSPLTWTVIALASPATPTAAVASSPDSAILNTDRFIRTSLSMVAAVFPLIPRLRDPSRTRRGTHYPQPPGPPDMNTFIKAPGIPPGLPTGAALRTLSAIFRIGSPDCPLPVPRSMVPPPPAMASRCSCANSASRCAPSCARAAPARRTPRTSCRTAWSG